MATAAAAAASENLTCSICLGPFDCPTTLSCGHSFCLRCLEDAWEAAGSYSCPQCRVAYEQKPQLSRNVTLANLVEELGQGERVAHGVTCDSCLDGAVPAVRTCLTCEMSLCESHYKRHSQNPKLKDHELVEVGVDTEVRKCKRHKERLKFFCTQDESLVCTSCAIVGEHKGHELSSVEDAHEARKTRIGEETRAVEEKKREAEAYVVRMEAARKHTQDSITQTKARITAEFTRRREKMDKDETEALERVEVKGCEVLSQIEENIALHMREISEMQAAAARLRALEQERDPLTFLQGHLEETRRREIPKKSPPARSISLDTTTMDALGKIRNRFLRLVYGCSPTVDLKSADNSLQISRNLRTVTRTSVSQGRPKHPRRFEDYPQALCSASYSSAQHNWEVDLRGSTSWRIGAAYGTIARKRGVECLLGENDVSWSLLTHNNICSVHHGGVGTTLSVQQLLRRVEVHLDWDAGLLSFYCADSMTLLHTFHQKFTQPLYPALGVWDGSVTILDLSRAF